MIPTTAYLWNQNARWTVWDLDAYRARHPMPWKPATVPAPVKPPEPVPTTPTAPRVDDAKLPGVTVDTTVVFDSDVPVSKVALLETQLAAAQEEIIRLRCERTEYKGAAELLKMSLDEKVDIITELRAGMDAIRDRVALALEARNETSTKRGLLPDLDLALAPRSSTAPSVQHEPGQSTNDNSVKEQS